MRLYVSRLTQRKDIDTEQVVQVCAKILRTMFKTVMYVICVFQHKTS